MDKIKYQYFRYSHEYLCKCDCHFPLAPHVTGSIHFPGVIYVSSSDIIIQSDLVNQTADTAQRSHLFDTLQTVIGLLYVSVHRRNRVHVDCPSSASTCQPLNWSVLQQKHGHVLKHLFPEKLPIPSPLGYCSLVRTCVCVCVVL